MLTSALVYARHGFQVFPLLSRSKVPFKGSRGVKDATKHRGKIRQWWGETPDANIAIATGMQSEVFALDVDPRNGGDKALADLETKHGPLPRTVTAQTGGGGVHYLFRWPGWRVKNDNAGKVGPGIDVKGDGGYIVAAPSIHENGTAYRWADGLSPNDLEVADAPAWLLSLVAAKIGNGTESPEAISVFSVLSVPTLDDAIRLTLPADEGQRHARLFTFARALKAIPDCADAELPALKPIVRQWHKAALPNIRTKDFETTWADFVAAWPRVRCPLGTGPMTEAIKRAKRAGLPKCAKPYQNEAVRLLVKLCRELQKRAGDGPFYLSARIAGDAIGIPKTNAHGFLLMLLADKVLSLVEPGTKTKAARYRYIGDDAGG